MAGRRRKRWYRVFVRHASSPGSHVLIRLLAWLGPRLMFAAMRHAWSEHLGDRGY